MFIPNGFHFYYGTLSVIYLILLEDNNMLTFVWLAMAYIRGGKGGMCPGCHLRGARPDIKTNGPAILHIFVKGQRS